jgi:opacity protein-like surface antigen
MKYNAQETNSPPTFFTNFISNATLTNTKSGWVAGGGVETMVVPHILLRVEYLYYGLSNDESRVGFPASKSGSIPTGI